MFFSVPCATRPAARVAKSGCFGWLTKKCVMSSLLGNHEILGLLCFLPRIQAETMFQVQEDWFVV
jgi:hypothetical protein